jgi:putative FmdB family regulatory protein
VPIYEYKCTKCGKELEVMHKVSDPAPAECPECKAQGSLEKLVSRTSFQLKGGGWYSDLYASAKKDSSSGTSTPAASGGTSTTTTTAPAAPSTPSSSGSGSSGTGGGGSTS